MMSVPLRRWPPSSRGNCVIDRTSRWASSLSSPALPTLAAVHSSSAHQQPNQLCILSRPRTSLYHHQCISRSLHLPINPLVSLSRNPARLATQSPPVTTPIRTMSSDDAYMSFLNKANADLDTARSNQQTSSNQDSAAARTETVHTGVSIPGPLTSVDAFYISETDEPFEPVALKWDGANRGVWPDASNFSNLIASSDDLAAAIETLSPASFDPRNQYAAALRAVRAAASQASGGGEPGVQEADVDVKVYRVEVGSARVEYYVLALDAEGGLLVGLRAKAIES